MKITQSDLDALRVNLSLTFNGAFNGTAAWWNRVAMYNPTTEKTGRMGWLANLPQMRELVGSRVMQNIAERSYDIVNKDRDLSLEIHRDQVETAIMGGFATPMRALGETAAKYPDKLIATLMQAGATSLCFDGQYFFDNDHPVSLSNSSLSTYSNVDASGKSLTLENYVAARAAMMARKGENGEMLGVMPNLLVVPPQLEHVARQIVMSDYVINTAGATPAAGAAMMTNVMKGTAEALVLPELANEATTWYLLDCRGTVKPFVYQSRREINFELLGYDSEHFKKTNHIAIIGDASNAAGYGLPQLAYKGVA